MHKTLISIATAVTLLGAATPAFASSYSLPGPVTVSQEAPAALGSGTVDFSRPSVVEGTFTVSNAAFGLGEKAIVTAGDVSNGGDGYGFYVYDDKLFGVSSNSGTNWHILLGFVAKNQPITVRAVYTPGDGVRFDTMTVSPTLSQYSRGIIQGMLPSGYVRSIGALYGMAKGTTAVVGGWSYNEGDFRTW